MPDSTARRHRPAPPAQSNPVPDFDHERIEAAVREILLAVGEDPDREGLQETPARVARMYAELFAGLHRDPRDLLKKTFEQKYDEMVVVRDIRFESCCEHHLLPFFGRAHIAYLPQGRVVGLSKLARVVEVLSRRPQVQERMTEELADLLMTELDARGVGVVLEATHTCMTIRGVRKPDSVCSTSAMRGTFRENQATLSRVSRGFDPASPYGDFMLSVFTLRLAAGMIACLLLLSPSKINPRYFRTHFLTAFALGGLAVDLRSQRQHQLDDPRLANRGDGGGVSRLRVIFAGERARRRWSSWSSKPCCWRRRCVLSTGHELAASRRRRSCCSATRRHGIASRRAGDVRDADGPYVLIAPDNVAGATLFRLLVVAGGLPLLTRDGGQRGGYGVLDRQPIRLVMWVMTPCYGCRCVGW